MSIVRRSPLSVKAFGNLHEVQYTPLNFGEGQGCNVLNGFGNLLSVDVGEGLQNSGRGWSGGLPTFRKHRKAPNTLAANSELSTS